MNVSCESCKQLMACIEKTQDEGLATTKSIYVCDFCHIRIQICRHGVRKEDPTTERCHSRD